jgi:hypothetical protein
MLKFRDKKGDAIVSHFDGEGKNLDVNAVALSVVARPFLISARCDENPLVLPLQIIQNGTESAELSSTDWFIPMFCFYCALVRLCTRYELPVDIDVVSCSAFPAQSLVRFNNDGLYRIFQAYLVNQLRDDRQMRFIPVRHAAMGGILNRIKFSTQSRS